MKKITQIKIETIAVGSLVGGGVFLVEAYSSWQVMVGVFCMMLANNLSRDQSARNKAEREEPAKHELQSRIDAVFESMAKERKL